MKESLIIVVDMVKGFVDDGALVCASARGIVPAITRLIEGAEASVVHVCDTHSPDCEEFSVFPSHCVEGTAESQVIDQLAGFGEIVPKNSTNAFFALKEHGFVDRFDRFVIVGVCTDICVLQLALTLRAYLNEKNRKGEVIVASDAIDTFDSPDHDRASASRAAISLMSASGVDCSQTTTQLIQSLKD